MFEAPGQNAEQNSNDKGSESFGNVGKLGYSGNAVTNEIASLKKRRAN
jgi:hypothetical protein